MNNLSILIRESIHAHGLQRKKMPWYMPWRKYTYVSGTLVFYVIDPDCLKRWFVELPGGLNAEIAEYDVKWLLNDYRAKADRTIKKTKHDLAVEDRAKELLQAFRGYNGQETSGDLGRK